MKVFWFIFSLLIGSVFADVDITAPDSGQRLRVSSGTVEVEVTWDDDGNAPSLDDFNSFDIILCTGPNEDIQRVAYLAQGLRPADLDGTYRAEIQASAGANGNYFIQIYSAISTAQFTIHYTPRFTLSGMTGSETPSGSGAPPSPQINIPNGGASAVDSASFTIPYTLQTGRTRYAPMQSQPGSTTTHTTWSRRFPTSAVTYYSSLRASPNVASTITPGWSYSKTSYINDATPAPHPSINGWYRAGERIRSVTSRNPAASDIRQKRRWLD